MEIDILLNSFKTILPEKFKILPNDLALFLFSENPDISENEIKQYASIRKPEIKNTFNSFEEWLNHFKIQFENFQTDLKSDPILSKYAKNGTNFYAILKSMANYAHELKMYNLQSKFLSSPMLQDSESLHFFKELVLKNFGNDNCNELLKQNEILMNVILNRKCLGENNSDEKFLTLLDHVDKKTEKQMDTLLKLLEKNPSPSPVNIVEIPSKPIFQSTIAPNEMGIFDVNEKINKISDKLNSVMGKFEFRLSNLEIAEKNRNIPDSDLDEDIQLQLPSIEDKPKNDAIELRFGSDQNVEMLPINDVPFQNAIDQTTMFAIEGNMFTEPLAITEGPTFPQPPQGLFGGQHIYYDGPPPTDNQQKAPTIVLGWEKENLITLDDDDPMEDNNNNSDAVTDQQPNVLALEAKVSEQQTGEKTTVVALESAPIQQQTGGTQKDLVEINIMKTNAQKMLTEIENVKQKVFDNYLQVKHIHKDMENEYNGYNENVKTKLSQFQNEIQNLYPFLSELKQNIEHLNGEAVQNASFNEKIVQNVDALHSTQKIIADKLTTMGDTESQITNVLGVVVDNIEQMKYEAYIPPTLPPLEYGGEPIITEELEDKDDNESDTSMQDGNEENEIDDTRNVINGVIMDMFNTVTNNVAAENKSDTSMQDGNGENEMDDTRNVINGVVMDMFNTVTNNVAAESTTKESVQVPLEADKIIKRKQDTRRRAPKDVKKAKETRKYHSQRFKKQLEESGKEFYTRFFTELTASDYFKDPKFIFKEIVRKETVVLQFTNYFSKKMDRQVVRNLKIFLAYLVFKENNTSYRNYFQKQIINDKTTMQSNVNNIDLKESFNLFRSKSFSRITQTDFESIEAQPNPMAEKFKSFTNEFDAAIFSDNIRLSTNPILASIFNILFNVTNFAIQGNGMTEREISIINNLNANNNIYFYIPEYILLYHYKLSEYKRFTSDMRKTFSLLDSSNDDVVISNEAFLSGVEMLVQKRKDMLTNEFKTYTSNTEILNSHLKARLYIMNEIAVYFRTFFGIQIPDYNYCLYINFDSVIENTTLAEGIITFGNTFGLIEKFPQIIEKFPGITPFETNNTFPITNRFVEVSLIHEFITETTIKEFTQNINRIIKLFILSPDLYWFEFSFLRSVIEKIRNVKFN